MAEKTCKTCLVSKDETEFYRAPHSSARRAHCKTCVSAKRKAEYRAGSPSRSRDVSYAQVLAREYDLTLDRYNVMVRQQAHRCAICRRAETMRSRSGQLRRLAVDHDHVTGAVRGLLCHRCNLLVWAIEDNHTTLDAIRRYVEEFRASFRNGPPL